jgi:hypothetical protein
MEGDTIVWVKWAKRAVSITALGGLLLTLSAGLSMAQPGAPDSAISSDYQGGTAPDRQDPVEAQAAPSVSITAPSSSIGDFGASQGNVWDMASTSDIVWTQEPFPLEKRPEGSIVRGYIPEGEDLAVAFYAGATNLPSSQYHHLTYKLKIAKESNCMTNGRVIYARNWPNWLGSQVYTMAILAHEQPTFCAYGEWCIYYIDLSSDNVWSPVPPSPWPGDSVKAFGMWPHERWENCGGGPNYFELDYVYLTGDIVATKSNNHLYTLRWNVSDPDSNSIVSTIRYLEVDELRRPADAPACNAGNFGDATTPPPSYPRKTYLPLVTKPGTASSGTWQKFPGGDIQLTTSRGAKEHTLNFSSSVFEDGKSYYICIRASDGSSQSYAVSTAPVIRVPISPSLVFP